MKMLLEDFIKDIEVKDIIKHLINIKLMKDGLKIKKILLNI
jgi:hypothetical protein